MSLETDLQAALEAICPRVFVDSPRDKVPARPFIVWQQLGGQVLAPLGGEAPDKRNAFISVHVWGERREDINAMALAVEAALLAATLPVQGFLARPQSAFVALMEEDVDLVGTSQDFSIWAAR